MSDEPKERALHSLGNRATRSGDGMNDKPTENQILDRWGAITLWIVGGISAVALGFLVWFVLLLYAASRL